MNEAPYSPQERLHELLEYISNYPRQRRFKAIGSKQPPKEGAKPFEHILYASKAFLSGALPEAETLFFIAQSLDKYISREGKLSLDEAFGLKSVSGSGNPSKIYARNNHKVAKLFDMFFLRKSNPYLTVENAAGEVCSNDENEKEASTLQREYSRGKWLEIEKKLGGK